MSDNRDVRASCQAQLAGNKTIVGERRVIFPTSEGILASRLAPVPSALADEIERGGVS